MTAPSITHGHGYLNDCDASDPTTFYSENRQNMDPAHATPSTLYGDVLQIEAIFDDGATEEIVYYEKDITNISTNTYSKYLLRYKTSASSAGAHAQVMLDFTAGDQTILDDAYSTTWKIATGDITSGKTVDKIRFYADDDGTNGTFYVYYDFLLLHNGIFTLPNVAYDLEFRPPPRYASIPIPSRVGDITQNMGSESATVRMSCDLDIDNDTDDWKRPQGTLSPKTDYDNGEVFKEIAHRSYTEPWQWLDTGTEQFKVTLEEPVFRRMGTGHVLDLLFREKRVSCGSNESYVERFGLDQ